jgi:L-fucose mutarotase
MLKGISPLISPDLLSVMASMGHGDELVLADAHFPGESTGKRIVRADGLRIADLLEAIMPLFELDSYVPHPLIMMEPVPGDNLDPAVRPHTWSVLRRCYRMCHLSSGLTALPFTSGPPKLLQLL